MTAKRGALRKTARILVRTVGVIVALAVIVPASLYLPPVQDWACSLAVREVRKATGLDVSISRLRLRWPLRLSVSDVAVVSPPADTMLTAGRLDVGVAVLPLLRGSLEVNHARLDAAFYQMGNADSLMWLRAHLRHAEIDGTRLRLKMDSLLVDRAEVDGAAISLVMKPDTAATPPDSAATKPMLIRAREITLRDVDYAMSMMPVIDSLGCHVALARLTDGRVDLGRRLVDVASLTVDSVTARYFYPSPATAALYPASAPSATQTPDSLMWTVRGGRLRLGVADAVYAMAGARPRAGFDTDWIEVTGATVEVDSFYNRGMAVRVPLRRLQATERCGLALAASGLFEMDSAAMRARGFDIRAGASTLHLDAMMGTGDLAADPSLPLALDADAYLQMADLVRAFPAMKAVVGSLPRPRTLKMAARLSGTSGSLALERLKAVYPGLLDLAASGRIDHPFDPRAIGGRLKIDGRMTAAPALKASLTKAHLMPGLALPRRMTVKGTVDYSPGLVGADLAVTADDGRAALKGRWNGRAEKYDLALKADRFPVGAFMPGLGVGDVTATLTASGHGLDPMSARTALGLDLDVADATYLGTAYRGIRLKADVGDGSARGFISSSSPDASLDIDFSAAMRDDAWQWDVDGDIHSLDLRAMHLSETPLKGSLGLRSTGRYSPASRSLDATLALDNIDVAMGDMALRTPMAELRAALTDSTASLALTNGDLRASLDARCPVDSLAPRLAALAPALRRQIADKRIQLDSLRRVLPVFTLDLSAGTDNLAADYLADTGLGFSHLSLVAVNDSTARLSARMLGFNKGTTQLDTLTFTAVQRGDYLVYNAAMANRPGTLDEFARVNANGYFGNNRLSLLLRQRNIKGQTGYRLGLLLTTHDSTLTLSIQPNSAVVAYRDWQVNADNHFTLDFRHQSIDADISISNPTGYLRLLTEPTRVANAAHPNDLVLQAAGIQLQDWLSANPFMPAVKGVVGANARVNWSNHGFAGNGDISLADFAIGRRRVGDFNLDFNLVNEPTGAVRADIGLKVDSARVLTLRGLMNDSTAREPLTLECDVDRLPLALVNPFLPPATATLRGALDGRMTLRGSLARPRLDGWLAFDSTAVKVAMLGQEYSFSDEKIPVDSSIVRLDDFAILGSNENPLTINGYVDLNSLTDPRFDLKATAADMMVLNSPRARGADVYGKGFISLDAQARGSLSFMRVDADISLLSGSNVTYVAAGSQSSIQSLVSGNSDMVKFVNFNDTAQVAVADSVQPLSAMILDANLNVEEGTTINVDLSADGKNRVQIQGQGDLDYTMSPVNPGRLTGRFTVAKGFVRYTPPMMSEKHFDLEEGSYVAFTGDMLNPILNIQAVDHLKANVTQTGQNSRLVTFDIGVSVTNTLQNMNVAFDLSTDDDITVENELQGMTPEQRASQAMNLLLYNVYTGPGTKGNASIGGNILFSFLESRINSWAASAIPGVDISFGVEQYDRTLDGATSTTTSYSYRVSKSLFNDRFKIIVGGNYSTDANADENFSQNLINDISFEYLLNRSGSMYVRVFRHTGYESILEGEITQTGVGFVYKRKLDSLRDLFRMPSIRRKAARTTTPADDRK